MFLIHLHMCNNTILSIMDCIYRRQASSSHHLPCRNWRLDPAHRHCGNTRSELQQSCEWLRGMLGCCQWCRRRYRSTARRIDGRLSWNCETAHTSKQNGKWSQQIDLKFMSIWLFSYNYQFGFEEEMGHPNKELMKNCFISFLHLVLPCDYPQLCSTITHPTCKSSKQCNNYRWIICYLCRVKVTNIWTSVEVLSPMSWIHKKLLWVVYSQRDADKVRYWTWASQIGNISRPAMNADCQTLSP